MIGKIVTGTSFSGCVNYVLKEDKSRVLKAVGVYGSPEEIAEQFELQTLLNDKVKNKVGHISLSFSAEDGDRIRDDDGLMLKIAHDYMKLMGIENTQFIIARHTDRNHPHCHIVYNRVDNDGRTISDKNDRYRNEKVCKMLTARYRLYFTEGKEHVNFMQLRRHDKVKYFICHALKREVPNARSWSELRLALRRYGIDTQWKLSRTTGEMEGVKFTCNQLTFSGSKIDRQFSFLNIDQELRYNALSATMNQRWFMVAERALYLSSWSMFRKLNWRSILEPLKVSWLHVNLTPSISPVVRLSFHCVSIPYLRKASRSSLQLRAFGTSRFKA